MQVLINTDSHIASSAELTNEVNAVLQHALGRFSDRITRAAVYFSDENSSDKFGDADKRCLIEARLGGLQPITVSHQGASREQALSGAAGKLEKVLKRTLGRKDSLYKRSARKRAELTAAHASLERDAEAGKQDAFVQALRPLLGYLGEHARREIRILEASGALRHGQIIVSDVLDELAARAWLRFGDRPRSMALDLWLTRMLDEILADQASRGQTAKRSLEELSQEAPLTSEGPQVDDQQWWIWLLGDGDAAAQPEELASRQSAWAEEFLEAEELIQRIHALLGDLPTPARQAFVLNVLEAHELYEVAMIQDRPETDVRADVQRVRDYLREQLRGAAPEQASTAS